MRDALAELAELLAGGQLTEAEALLLIAELEAEADARQRATWRPYPWQVPPGQIPTQGIWLQLGGRGTGKTDGCARYMDEHARGPACDRRLPGGHRMAIVAPTLGDASESCVDGPSGLRAHNPQVIQRTAKGGTYVRWPSGATAKLFGAHSGEDVERLRSGGNRCLTWLEEVAAMRHLGSALTHAALGLRIGPTPHFIGSTTPKPRAELRELIAEPTTLLTRGRTRDAVHLAPAVREFYERKYSGTRLGRQELEGEVLDDVEGALWTYDRIEAGRVDATPELLSIAVTIDPSVSATEDSDECGIVATGLGADGTVYVLADRSARVAGVEAARRAWQLWIDLGANHMVYEGNQGKKWVADVLRQVWAELQREGQIPVGAPPLREVTAVVGKRLRAEPVATLWELSPPRARFVGALPELADQCCNWVPETGKESPDRIDAMVHSITFQLGRLSRAETASPVGRSRSAMSGGRPGGAGGRPRRR